MQKITIKEKEERKLICGYKLERVMSTQTTIHNLNSPVQYTIKWYTILEFSEHQELLHVGFKKCLLVTEKSGYPDLTALVLRHNHNRLPHVHDSWIMEVVGW